MVKQPSAREPMEVNRLAQKSAHLKEKGLP